MTDQEVSLPYQAGKLFRVDGLVAVITGGGSGIGKTIALTLAANGAAKVYVLGRRLEPLQSVASSPTARGIVVPIQADVTSKDQLAAAAKQVREEVGHVNLFVANAGASGPNLFGLKPNASPQELQSFIWDKWETQDYTNIFDLNATSVLFGAIAFLDLLDVGNKKGNVKAPSQVLVTASVASYTRAVSGSFSYVISKAAAQHTAKVLSTYLTRYNIRVNTINPAVYETELNTKAVAAKLPGFDSDKLPAKRLVKEEDLVGATLYLASEAGAYLNGLSLVVDGGLLGTVPSTY